MTEPAGGGGAGDLDAIAAAIMAGKPESIRKAATVFGDTTRNYGAAHEAYLADTKKLMKTWEGAGAETYLGVANRLLAFIDTTQETISPNEAALNDAADALEEAQRAITEYTTKAQEYRDAMAANEQDPDEAALTAEGQRILDALVKAYHAAAGKLKPIDNVHPKVGQKTIDPPSTLILNTDAGGAPDSETAPGAPPPGAAATVGDGATGDAAPAAPAVPPPGGAAPPGQFLVSAPPGGPGGLLGGAPGDGPVPASMLLSTPDGSTCDNATPGPAGPGVPVVPGIGSPLDANLATDVGPGGVPGGVPAGAMLLGVGNPSATGPGAEHSSTACSDPSCTDPSHGVKLGDPPVLSIGGDAKAGPPPPHVPAPSPLPDGTPPESYLLTGSAPPAGTIPPALSTPATTLNTFGSSPDAAAAALAAAPPPAAAAATALGTANLAGMYPPMAGAPAGPGGAVGAPVAGTRLSSSRFPGGAGPGLPAEEPTRLSGQLARSSRPMPEVPVAPFEPGGALAGFHGTPPAGQGGMRVLGGDDWDDAEAVSEAIGRPR